MNLKQNKKGWIKIMEAFISILIIMVVILIVIDQGYSPKKINSEYIINKEITILREIQLNESLRAEILSSTPPLGWEDAGFPSETKNKIIEKTPDAFECVAELCSLEDNCIYEDSPDQNTYTKSVVISANLNSYSPKQLKIFCWED